MFEGAPGSSPLTRGAREKYADEHAVGGIIPAYAGSTATAFSRLSIERDHPRLRGEHLDMKFNNVSDAGSSPLTRGAPT